MTAAGGKDTSLQSPLAAQDPNADNSDAVTSGFGADLRSIDVQPDLPMLRASDSEAASRGEFCRTLRITCPGELRREKNQVAYLQPLVNNIWESHLSTGNVRIVLQRPAKKWHAKKPKLEINLPESALVAWAALAVVIASIP